MTQPWISNRPAAQYIRAITGMLDGYAGRMNAITPIAEQCADRLIAGGNIYAVSDEEGFMSEACGRSGGIRQIEHFQHDPHPALGDRDVVLAGTLNHAPDRFAAQLSGYRDSGALVVLFGSADSTVRDAADALVENGLPVGTHPVLAVSCREEPVCPVAGVANIAGLWIFTCELVAACTRRGRTLTMYQSGGMPGGGARIHAYEKLMFHEDLCAPPVDPGSLGRQFLDHMNHCFTRIGEQFHLFYQGGALMAQSLERGRRVWVSGNAHHFSAQDGMPGDPKLFSLNMNGMEHEEAYRAFHQEDTFAYMGYYGSPDPLLTATRRVQMHSVWLQGGCETMYFQARPQEILIDCGWKHGDACIHLPGYDIPIVPPSGVVQTAALWALVGEAAGLVEPS